MKLTSNQAKSLLTKLGAAKVGGLVDIEMGPLLGGFNSKPVLTLMETLNDKYWLLQVSFGGSVVCEVSAEIYKEDLLLEVL